MGESVTQNEITQLRPQWKRQDFTRGPVTTPDSQRSSLDATSPKTFNSTSTSTPFRTKTPSNNSTPRAQPSRPINRSYSGNVRTSRDGRYSPSPSTDVQHQRQCSSNHRGDREQHNNGVDRQQREDLSMLFPEGPGRQQQRREQLYTSSPRLKTSALVSDKNNDTNSFSRPLPQQQNGGFTTLSRSQTAPALPPQSPLSPPSSIGTPAAVNNGQQQLGSSRRDSNSGNGPDFFATSGRAPNVLSSWRKSSSSSHIHSPRHAGISNDRRYSDSGASNGGESGGRHWHSKLVSDAPPPHHSSVALEATPSPTNLVNGGSGSGVWGTTTMNSNGIQNEKPTAASIVAASLTTSTNKNNNGSNSSNGGTDLFSSSKSSIDLMAKQAKLVPIAAFSKDTDKHKKNSGLLLQRQSSAQAKLQTAVGSALARSRSDAASNNINSSGLSNGGNGMVVMELKRKPSKFSVLGGVNNKPSSSSPSSSPPAATSTTSSSDSNVASGIGNNQQQETNAAVAHSPVWKTAATSAQQTMETNANNNGDNGSGYNNKQQQQNDVYESTTTGTATTAAIDNGAAVSAPLEVLALEDEFLMSLGFIAEEILN